MLIWLRWQHRWYVQVLLSLINLLLDDFFLVYACLHCFTWFFFRFFYTQRMLLSPLMPIQPAILSKVPSRISFGNLLRAFLHRFTLYVRLLFRLECVLDILVLTGDDIRMQTTNGSGRGCLNQVLFSIVHSLCILPWLRTSLDFHYWVYLAVGFGVVWVWSHDCWMVWWISVLGCLGGLRFAANSLLGQVFGFLFSCDLSVAVLLHNGSGTAFIKQTLVM